MMNDEANLNTLIAIILLMCSGFIVYMTTQTVLLKHALKGFEPVPCRYVITQRPVEQGTTCYKKQDPYGGTKELNYENN